MGQTANNSWNYPASSDLVKDGATAIQTLADDIDTTLGVYGAPGLVKINTTTFSAVSSQSLNSVFTSTYKDYKIVLSDLIGSTTTQDLSMRLRKSGTDNTSNIYHRDWIRGAGVTLTGAREQNTSYIIGGVISTGTNMSVWNIFSPQIATSRTNLIGMASFQATNDMVVISIVFSHDLTSSADFDGFTIYPASGTFSGTVQVFGYKA